MKKINLTIANPCHENWDSMSEAEKGRFCSACQKTVVDFTDRSDRQIAEFFKKPVGTTCGRFHLDQLGRDMVIPTKRIPWVQYLFQILIPAFLLTIKAQGQKNVRIGRVAISSNVKANEIVNKPLEKEEDNRITGKVTDEYGHPVPHASVVIKGTNQGVASDTAGRFELPYNLALPFTLTISSIGFESIEQVVLDTAAKELLLPVLKRQMMGEVVVVGYTVPKKKEVPLLRWFKSDTLQQHLQIYPNPVRSYGNITIESKKLVNGTYLLQLMTIDGKAVYTKSIESAQKGGLLRTDLPALIPGAYLLTLTHQPSDKVYTKKIQVL